MMTSTEDEGLLSPPFCTNEISLCSPIPSYTPHAVSVSLPKWQDNVDYEEGRPRVVELLKSGYPRFCLHVSVKKLCAKVIERSGYKGTCYCFPSRRVTKECRSFIIKHASPDSLTQLVTLGEYIVPAIEKSGFPVSTLYVVFLPKELFSLAKAFWQHTGEIISSRYAEHCLRSWEFGVNLDNFPAPPRSQRYKIPPSLEKVTVSEQDSNTYIEERYGRNLDIQSVIEAKLTMRRRIAAALQSTEDSCSASSSTSPGPISSNDVYLFPTGMSAIYNSHRLALKLGGSLQSVCFGFPYTDTLKILQKFGPGCHFLGLGEDNDLEALEVILNKQKILALYCEFPSNPLLQSPPLQRIRELANKHDFLIVVDDTISCLVNVHLLEVADIIVSSLTKIFSGDSNVMGGSLTLSPRSAKYNQLKTNLDTQYEDLFWCEDAIFLERNSRSFETRVHEINKNTEILCDFLQTHPLVKCIHYPKFSTPEAYQAYQRPNRGYGGLFSIEFKTPSHAIPFYDHLPCAKGPSLGTNFTLACPYTLLAHYSELEWAAKYKVNPHLVRIAVGLEGPLWLKWAFTTALNSIII